MTEAPQRHTRARVGSPELVWDCGARSGKADPYNNVDARHDSCS